jgi:hypothetical protein
MPVLLPILFRVTPTARNPVAGHLVRKPTRKGGRALLRPTTGHPGRYETLEAPRWIIYQGIMRLWLPRGRSAFPREWG